MTCKILSGFIFAILIISCNSKTNFDKEASVKSQLVWTGTGPDFITGDISPDGIFFTDINWNIGDIKLVNLETGEEHELTGKGYDSGGYSWMSSFSNSGDKIAYEWYNYDTGSHELRLFTFNDSLVRTLIPSKSEISYLEPLDWTKDDQHILIAKQFNETNWELGMVSVTDGNYKPIIPLDWKTPGGLHPFAYPSAYLSPDDKYIGFDYKLSSSNDNDLVLVSVETGKMTVLFENEGDDRFLSWINNGKEVLFYSDRSESPSVWKLKVNNGKPYGEPELIKSNIEGLAPIGLTDKGFAYGVGTGTNNTYFAKVDFETGKVIKKPFPVDSNCYCRNNVGDWSKDGDSLLFVRFREFPSSRESVVIKSVTSGQEREVFFPWAFHNKTGSVKWISQNKVLVDGNSPEQSGLHIFDLTSQTLEFIDLGNEGFFQRFTSNSNGSKIYVQIRFGNPSIVEFDLITGEKKTVFEGNSVPASVAISPDDNTLAFLQNNPETRELELKTLDIGTGISQTINIRVKGRLSSPVSWNPDGTGLFAGVSFSRKDRGLWHISLKEEIEPVFIDLPQVQAPALLISPDGNHLGFQSGEAKGNLYFLEGF